MKIYTTRRYQKLRKRILAHEPLCRMCAADGFTVAASRILSIHATARPSGGSAHISRAG